jgi:hypothetical protein
MANRNHMQVVPNGRWARARWLDEHFPKILQEMPYDGGLSAIAQLERRLFPPAPLMPLDPTCPECGRETEEGTVERSADRQCYRIRYDCGHVLELTEEEISQKLRGDGRAA